MEVQNSKMVYLSFALAEDELFKIAEKELNVTHKKGEKQHTKFSGSLA